LVTNILAPRHVRRDDVAWLDVGGVELVQLSMCCKDLIEGGCELGLLGGSQGEAREQRDVADLIDEIFTGAECSRGPGYSISAPCARGAARLDAPVAVRRSK